jgi:hypothetical protein
MKDHLKIVQIENKDKRKHKLLLKSPISTLKQANLITGYDVKLTQ